MAEDESMVIVAGLVESSRHTPRRESMKLYSVIPNKVAQKDECGCPALHFLYFGSVCGMLCSIVDI